MERRILLLLFFIFLLKVGFAQDLPELNRKVFSYCEEHKGKKVGKGECWDLAKEALDNAGAQWNPPYEFGKKLNLKTEALLPGDILQFENARIVNPDKTVVTLPHHTAIVVEVKSNAELIIAEQNSNHKRFVVYSPISLSGLQKGKVEAFRPN